MIISYLFVLAIGWVCGVAWMQTFRDCRPKPVFHKEDDQ